MKIALFLLALLIDARAFACQEDEQPDPLSIFWEKENTVGVHLINRANDEYGPISFIVKIDGVRTQKMGPYETRYGSTVDFQIDGLSPSAHTFTFQSVSGRTGCVSEETKPEKLESWYEHTHRPDLSEGIRLPYFYDFGGPPH